MNIKHQILFLFLVLGCCAFEYPPPPVYPVAPSGAEFEKEAEAFVISKSFHLDGTGVKEKLQNDARNWEPVLEKLIRDPLFDGTVVSGIAFGYTIHRGTAKNPEIVVATGELFKRHVEDALRRYEKNLAEGNPTHPSVTGSFPRVTHQILDVGAPSHLTRVLDYLNSPADEKIRLINRNTPTQVADAIRNYGDSSHLEGAAHFAKKLRDIGKSDIADDIERSIERIKKEAVLQPKASAGKEVGKGKADGAGDKSEAKNSSGGKPPWPWIAGAAGLFAAAVAYFRMKRVRP